MSQLSHENPDASEEELVDLAAAALLRGRPVDESTELETRECRDCGNPFRSRPSMTRTSKWGMLCPSCLRWEL